MKSYYLAFILLAVFLFSACGDDPIGDREDAAYVNGFFIVNEGPFNNGSGSISFVSNETEEVSQNVFSNANDGRVLGNILNSMSIIADKAYFVINNAAKIVVADAITLKFITEIVGIDQPRHMITLDNSKAYVSYWGADGLSGGIGVINLSNNELIKKIPLGKGPEKMIIKDNQLIVTLTGGYDRADEIVYVSTSTDEIISTQQVYDKPNSLSTDAAGNIWVLCGGFTDYYVPENSTQGRLVRLNIDDTIDAVTIPNGAKSWSINKDQTKAYYFDAVGVYEVDLSLQDINPVLVYTATSYYYGMSMDADNEVIFLTDAKDFSSPGEVIKISTSGELLATYAAGVIPSSCYAVD